MVNCGVDHPLPIRDTWVVRLLRAVGLVKVDSNTGEISHSAGADFVPDIAFRGGYDPKSALSALAAFPWPFACVQSISSDLSKVGLTLHRGKGAEAEVIPDHPFLDLIDQPSSRVGATLFRRQLYTDLILTGNAFILIAKDDATPQALLRLHPARVSISPLSDGQPDQYQYDGSGGQALRYSHEDILHIRNPSWSDDPSNLWGTGCVQPLHNDLTTELAQSALTARTAATGQPTGILSPREEGDRWSKEQIKTLRAAYESQMQSGGSGVLILGGQAQFDKMSFTPREMEFSSVRDFVRGATIAAFGAVPVRLGIESSNFATAQSQMRLYWEGLQGRAAIVDAELTRLARMFDETLTVRHDFSEVESLQESRTERLNRVVTWSMLGVPVSEAAAYEGFDDLPFTPADDVEESDEVPVDDNPLVASILDDNQPSSLSMILSSVATGAITFDAAMGLVGIAYPTIPYDETERVLCCAKAIPKSTSTPDVAKQILGLIGSIQHRMVLRGDGATWLAETDEHKEVWRNFIDEVHAPTERAYELAMQKYLRGFAARVAKRLPEVFAKRAVGSDTTILRVEGEDDVAWLQQLLASWEESKLVRVAMKDIITEAYERAIDAAYRAMPADLTSHLTNESTRDFTYDPVRLDKEVEENLGELITNVDNGTKRTVRKIIQDGLAEGATVNDLQALIMLQTVRPADLPAGYQGPFGVFSPRRALRIARTETTKSVNAGAIHAWEKQAADLGVDVEFTWLAAPDAREIPHGGHIALHNVVRSQDGFWHAGTNKARGPGQWEGPDDAALNINCRCTFTPRIVR